MVFDPYKAPIVRWGIQEPAVAQPTEQAKTVPARLGCTECSAELFAVHVDGDTGEVVCPVCATVVVRLSFTVSPRI